MARAFLEEVELLHLTEKNKRTPVILLGLHYSSLQIARRLGGRGVPIYGIDRIPNRIGERSRFIKKLDAPMNPEGLRDFLIAFSQRTGTRPVVFPLSDFYVRFLVKYREDLSLHCLFPHSPSAIERKLISKVGTAECLAHCEAPSPKTAVIKRDDSRFLFPELTFPCVLKPEYQEDWLENPAVLGILKWIKPVIYIENQVELERLTGLLSALGNLVLQEFIPGPATNIYYYVGYRSCRGRTLASFIGNKIRTFPNLLGSETLLRSVHMPQLLEFGRNMLHRLDYQGPAGIDIKFDPRDNTYKIIEINCRLGINDCYLSKYGHDLAYFYYLDSQNIEIDPPLDYPVDITWYNFDADFDWMRVHADKEKMSWASWLRQLAVGYDNYALFSWDDPGPFVYANYEFARRLADRFRKRIDINRNKSAFPPSNAPPNP